VLAIVVAILLADGSRSPNHAALPARSTTPTPPTSAAVSPRSCAADGMTLAIQVRRPSHQQL